jgi:hypothetical protein
MGRSIREQVGFDDSPPEDNTREPMDDGECGRKAGELSHRLGQTIYALEKQKHPATGSDWATLHDVQDFLDRLAASKSTEESLHDQLGLEDPRAAERRRKQLGEWLRR